MAARDRHLRFAPRRILGRLRRELDALLRRNRVVFFRCDPADGSQSARGELVEAGLERFEHWRRTEPGFPWQSQDEGERRFRDGHRLFAILADGSPRCYGWASAMQAFWINELGGVFGTDVTMTWIWDCVTPAAMRNQGHYTEFLKALRHKFRDHELLIYCHAHNAASYRAIRRAGFLPWANVTQHPRRTSIDILQTRFGHHLRAVAPAQRT